MTLVDLDIPVVADASLPDRVTRLLAEAHQRIDAFFTRRGGEAIAGYVPSDFTEAYRALRSIAMSGIAPGNAFLEWGHGFGVIALLAAHLGFSVCGIEIDPELVEESEKLAADFEVDADFVCGTFVPPGGEDLTDVPTEFGWFAAGGADGHDLLGVEPHDFDLIFAYPWPGEEQVIENLFLRYASNGALLLTYLGNEDFRLRRKVGKRL